MGKVSKKKGKSLTITNRLELRKKKRLTKKEKKRNFFSKKKKLHAKDINIGLKVDSNNQNKILGTESEIDSDFILSDEELDSKLTHLSKNVNKNDKVNSKKLQTINIKMNQVSDRFLEDQQREKRKEKELQKKMRKQRILQLSEANEEEDKIIKKLEKKLQIQKHSKNKSLSMFNDGLDYALELCLPENIDKMYSAAREAVYIEENESEDEFQNDLNTALGENSNKSSNKSTKKNMVLKKIEKKYFNEEDSDLSNLDSELEIDNAEMSEESENIDSDIDDNNVLEKFEVNKNDGKFEADSLCKKKTEFKSRNDCDKSEKIDQMSYNDRIEDISNEEQINANENPQYDSKNEHDEKAEWEDIYGRKRDAKGNIIENRIAKYIPPHTRNSLESEEGKIYRLKRQLKGLLNKLAESNIIKISKDIENLYRNNSRYEMNKSFAELLINAIVTNVLSKERLVLEHTMLIAILHVNVDNEISAYILQELVIRFHNLIENIEGLDVENKQLDNIIFIISHMYTFKIFQHALILEIINRLVIKLCEKSVECILLIFKSIGFQLRKDDPIAVRDIIFSIQKRSNEIGIEIQKNPRYKFLIEILIAIRNNNLYKIPQYDPSLAEHLKKIFKNMLTNGKYLSTLNITMDDLLNVDKIGKWWVVGSAWTGNIKDIGGSFKNEHTIKSKEQNFTSELLELAKKERMNTEDRRNIFCIIMSSEDYLDAFEKLLRLSIKDVRLIISIIIHCCLSEKIFNPYYSVLAEKFCIYDRKYFLAVQFAVWDKIKDIESLNKTQIENLGKFVLYLIRKGSQPISILKIVEFTELNKTTLRFVRIIILAILLGDKTEMLQIFKRIAPSTTLNHFKNAIMLFIRHFLLKGSKESHVPLDKLELLNERINEIEEILFNRNFI